MWPIKIVFHVFPDEWDPPNLSSRTWSPNKKIPEKLAIGERRSVTLYLCCHPACQRRGYRSLTRESEMWKGPRVEKKSIDGGPDTGPCLQTPRPDRYSLPGQWTILSRYLFTKSSHRKTIESNHEESDRRVFKRFFLGFWNDGFFNRHWTIFWKILQFGLCRWFYLLSMY